MEIYNLNLSIDYCESWGTWEVAREIYANAKDADSDFRVESPNKDTLIISTKTVPEFESLLIIGAGSKRNCRETIGQFGEGIKIAALAATRSLGSSLVLRLPDSTVRFEFRSIGGHSVLHAIKEDADTQDGYSCTLIMSGAGSVLENRTRKTQKAEVIRKSELGGTFIFSKGMWICENPNDNVLFSYNLPDISLNRDRSHADPFSIRWEVGKMLMGNMSDWVAEEMLQNPNSFESRDCYLESFANEKAIQCLESAFRKLYGPSAVIATDSDIREKVRAKNMIPVNVGDSVFKVLKDVIPLDIHIIGKSDLLEESFPKYDRDLFARLAGYIGMDIPEIHFFRDQANVPLGQFIEPNHVWINETMLCRSNDFELIRTFLHEMAHFHSFGRDATRQFESSLDLIATKLAVKLIQQEEKQ